MRSHTKRPDLALRALTALVAFGVLAVGASASATSTKEELDAAKRSYERLKDEIAAEQRRLDSLEQQAAVMAGRIEAAEGRLEKAEDDLEQTKRDIAEAQARYAELQIALGERARAAYMDGPTNDLEFLLGADSLLDLADRMQYVEALSQADRDLATEVENLANKLEERAARLDELTAERERALEELQSQEDALFAQLDEQQMLTESIQAKVNRAKALVADLSRKYQAELAALAAANGTTTVSAGAIGGILFQCPVDQPRVVYDGFGAPRYGGGYHPHAGNDIIAPMGTPIRAPFPGTARTSYNTLGGNAVYVYGDQGYVYNAHLSRYSNRSTGPVQTGDIIGYVGETGDTSTPHNHFEWHPNVMPGTWPTSPYGYRVIGGAVNPWPILQAVC
ncbi:MAG: murein hydrolase activator EnvC family protein [Actinomycetota bacterium]